MHTMLKTVIFKELTMSKAALNIANIDLLAPRTELHDKLNLSGCEMSVNNMAPGAQSPLCITTPIMRSATL